MHECNDIEWLLDLRRAGGCHALTVLLQSNRYVRILRHRSGKTVHDQNYDRGSDIARCRNNALVLWLLNSMGGAYRSLCFLVPCRIRAHILGDPTAVMCYSSHKNMDGEECAKNMY